MALFNVTVSCGGKLFEFWFFMFGKQKLWSQVVAATKSKTTISEALQQHCWKTHRERWYSWLLKGLKDISNKNTKQLFWITLVTVNRGLSNSGQELLGKFNWLLLPAVYQQHFKEQLALQVNKSFQLLKTQPCVWWIDNYNRSFGQPFYKLLHSPLQILNWTGFGAAGCSSTSTQQLLQRNPSSTMPLFPKQLNTDLQQHFLHQLFSNYWNSTKYFFSTESFCETHNIYNIPLKPWTTGPALDRNTLLQLEKEKLGTLEHFLPLSLLEWNVSSEEGLGKVLQYLQTVFEEQWKTHYTVAKVDINIFWRMYQVCLFVFCLHLAVFFKIID